MMVLLALPALAQSRGTPAAVVSGDEDGFFVVLAGRADLTTIEVQWSRADRGQRVVERLRESAATGQRGLRATLDERGIPYRSFYIVNAILVEGDAALARELAARPDVLRIARNPRVSNPLPHPRPAAARTGIEPGVQQVGAPFAWAQGFDGGGIVVGGADTGIDWTHPALRDRYRGWDGQTVSHDYHWHDSIHTPNSPCGADSSAPCDDNGHGTHTIGTAVGDDGDSNQIGVAPGATWIGCRNMEKGVGTPARYLECLEFFLAPYPVGGDPGQGRPELAPHITVNSWNCPPSEGCDAGAIELLRQGFEAQRAAGILSIAAVGNNGSLCESVLFPPGTFDEVTSVGALVTGSQRLASFSSRGPVTVDGSGRLKPDLVAPGTGTRSAWLGGGYVQLSGTSMAAPHVAGVAALLLQSRTTLVGDVAATEDNLLTTADPLQSMQCDPGGVPNSLFGHGLVDAARALGLVTSEQRLPLLAR